MTGEAQGVYGTHRSFEEALGHLKACDNRSWIQRSGWNGKDLKVRLQRPDEFSKMNLPYLYIEYPNGDKCPWLASQTDILACDWTIGIDS